MKNKMQSKVNLLGGDDSFIEKDPHWYRLIVILIKATFILLLAWMLKEWSIPLLANKWTRGTLGEIVKYFKGKLP